MSSVNSVGSNPSLQQVTNQPLQKQVPPSAPATPSAASDKVELSGVSHLLTSLKANDIRLDKVASVKAQIEAGTYEDDHKLDIAAGRLLDDLGE